MLAVGNGHMWLMSTPHGKRGSACPPSPQSCGTLSSMPRGNNDVDDRLLQSMAEELPATNSAAVNRTTHRAVTAAGTEPHCVATVRGSTHSVAADTQAKCRVRYST